jgi:hypothetical protein
MELAESATAGGMIGWIPTGCGSPDIPTYMVAHELRAYAVMFAVGKRLG